MGHIRGRSGLFKSIRESLFSVENIGENDLFVIEVIEHILVIERVKNVVVSLFHCLEGTLSDDLEEHHVEASGSQFAIVLEGISSRDFKSVVKGNVHVLLEFSQLNGLGLVVGRGSSSGRIVRVDGLRGDDGVQTKLEGSNKIGFGSEFFHLEIMEFFTISMNIFIFFINF